MHTVLTFATPLADFALFVARVTLGLFFVLARFRYFYDPALPAGERVLSKFRSDRLAHKMEYCGLTSRPHEWAAFVAIIEVAAGLACIAGLLTQLAALGLLAITVRATCCTGKEKTMRQEPIDRVDVASCYLWCPEPVYAVLALIVMVLGAGAWSLDAAVLAWLR